MREAFRLGTSTGDTVNIDVDAATALCDKIRSDLKNQEKSSIRKAVLLIVIGAVLLICMGVVYSLFFVNGTTAFTYIQLVPPICIVVAAFTFISLGVFFINRGRYAFIKAQTIQDGVLVIVLRDGDLPPETIIDMFCKRTDAEGKARQMGEAVIGALSKMKS